MRRPAGFLFPAILAVCVALGLVQAGARPAEAYANAFFHYQDNGNRGVDVLAIQYLLRAAGHAVEPDGVFGPETDAAVRAFQDEEGLGVDGIVGPQTWGALAVTLRAGASGDAVRALQVELNAKRRLDLAVDGNFGDGVENAVRSFQSHAGIDVDGIVGPVTWRNLVWHYDYPDFGAGICDQDPDGNGTANWATAAAIGQLERATRAFAATGQGEVPLGDAGFEHGGDIPGHSSHDVGLDIDVWPIRTDGAQCSAGRITWRSSTYDRAATRRLVQEIRSAASGHVALVFFNDPELIDEGLTSEWPNHDNHLHIRYCERVHPNSLYDC